MDKKLIEDVADMVVRATDIEKLDLIGHLQGKITGRVAAGMQGKSKNEIKREVLSVIQAGVTLNMAKPVDVMARLA